MCKPAFAVIVLLCLRGVLTPGWSAAQDTTPYLSLGATHTLESSVLNETREVIVGLPAGYDGSKESYPVVYLLDGPSHFHHTTGSVRYLATNDRIPGVIIVAIANTDRTRDLTPPTAVDSLGVFPTAGGADRFLSFIDGELKPYIESRYRTRPYAILIGHSFGGLFAIHALVHRPEVFDAYIAISPSLWWDEQRLVAQADSAFDHREELVGDLYMTMGNEGDDMLGGALKLTGVLEEKAPDTFRWAFDHMDAETHGSVPLRSTIDGLEKVFEGWYLHDPAGLFDTGGLAAVDRFFKRASDRFGYEKSTSNAILNQIGARALDLKEAGEAEAIYARLVEKQPQAANAHQGLAEAHALQGNREQAVEHYQHALRNDPRNQKAREQLTAYGVDLSGFPAEVRVPTEVLARYVGAYVFEDNTFNIALAGDGLLLNLEGIALHLYPLANDRFQSEEYPEIKVSFKPGEHGAIGSMVFEQAGEALDAVRRE